METPTRLSPPLPLSLTPVRAPVSPQLLLVKFSRETGEQTSAALPLVVILRYRLGSSVVRGLIRRFNADVGARAGARLANSARSHVTSGGGGPAASNTATRSSRSQHDPCSLGRAPVVHPRRSLHLVRRRSLHRRHMTLTSSSSRGRLIITSSGGLLLFARQVSVKRRVSARCVGLRLVVDLLLELGVESRCSA